MRLRSEALLVLAALLTAVPTISRAQESQVRLGDAEISHLSSLVPLAGRKLDPRQLEGRAVLVAFFSSWCPACNGLFERLRLTHLGHAAEGLTVVAIDVAEAQRGTPEEREARITQFLGRHEPIFSVVRGTGETMRMFGGVDTAPAVFVFDRAGRTRLAPPSPAGGEAPDPAELERAVRNALGFGAAWELPSLPDRPISVINLSYFRHLSGFRG